MNRQAIGFFLVLAICLMSCNKQENQPIEAPKNDVQMNSYISFFEIPATDISRAIAFYQSILDIKIEKMEMPGMEMGVFPYENQAVHAVIMKDDSLKPSANGITVYLNGGNDLQVALDKVEKNGGSVMLPKTAHPDESGFFALILDSEGNKLGLTSPN